MRWRTGPWILLDSARRERLVDTADVDKDGRISLEDFRRMLDVGKVGNAPASADLASPLLHVEQPDAEPQTVPES